MRVEESTAEEQMPAEIVLVPSRADPPPMVIVMTLSQPPARPKREHLGGLVGPPRT
jgi:hypothetical protein